MSDRKPVPESVREEVLEDADYRCEICPARGTEVGGDATLHLHHRESPMTGGTHDPDNLVVMCDGCHYHHHSGRMGPDEIETNLETVDIDPTPADFRLVSAIEKVAPATTGELAEEAGISDVHALRRLYALAAASIVSKTTNKEWDLAERVDEPMRGQLPDDPEEAARHARDILIMRMKDIGGLSHAEIAEIVGLSERTVPVAVNRARAFDPPLPPGTVNNPEIEDIARRLASLERLVGSS
ncbi:sigma factor-like helix-turn-helix DNA-binding protein [Halobium palmae]|uniref:Sigma factor-like helix-turn-helix DNA-binding protein n=1 Tax=Halobium palmae TaxID=1776492 RepID=A0ABD5RUL0_9EURY